MDIPKFRVYDKDSKIMYYDIEEIDFKHKEVIYYSWEECGETSYLFNTFDNCIIMQYTGFKDKNDKEIYEADILHWICVGKEGGNPEDVGVLRDMGNMKVIFKNGKFMTNKPYIPIGHFDTNEIEIVGNIYEDPDKFQDIK